MTHVIMQRRAVPAVIGAVILSLTSNAHGGSHLWTVHEVFSNADGTIQFVELWECCGSTGERSIGGLELTSEVNGSVFVIPAHLTENTANRHLLFATQGFADLPEAPTPDYIIQDNFFALDGDKVWYGPSANYDSFTFGPGDLPVDGQLSIQVTDFVTDAFVTGVNSPTNFDGGTASIDLRALPTVSTWGLIALALLLATGATVLLRRRTACDLSVNLRIQ